MRKRNVFLILLSFCLLSCSKKDISENDVAAHDLFAHSSSMIIDFTNQLKNSSDSAMVDSINELFERKIVEINFVYPANTDLKLTEQENDSLFYLLQNYRKLKEEKYILFSIHEPDSI